MNIVIELYGNSIMDIQPFHVKCTHSHFGVSQGPRMDKMGHVPMFSVLKSWDRHDLSLARG